MSGAASEAEATRARPLSGGLWSLLSWLRRDDSGASSDSLSSVGSDRTVASFAFLAPDRYRDPPAPLFLPPPGPPTDSYKRRLRDRNTRLQHDRDLTLHRKYGLFRGENSGYDAFSLPHPRKLSESRDRGERERRATSEGLQRRAAHVPGKRRAPPPPRAATLGAPRRPRKRPAPQPPRRPLSELCRTAIPEEPLPAHDTPLDPALRKIEAMDCKPEKYVKKDAKECKPRPERSFLKQIFESRKRNSAVDPVPERILPSISELDKQAAEIIESCKLKAIDRSNERSAGTSRELLTPTRGDMWFCTRCLRKYDDSVVTCGHCVTEQKNKLSKKTSDIDRVLGSRGSNHYKEIEGASVASTSGVSEFDEKQKLKEMLKEIKDSLPKRPKHEVNLNKTSNNPSPAPKPSVIEAPTLRIGSKVSQEEKRNVVKPTSKSNNDPIQQPNIDALSSDSCDAKAAANTTSTAATETAVVTQPIVFQHLPNRDIIKLEPFNAEILKQAKSSRDACNDKMLVTTSITKESNTTENRNNYDRGPSTAINIPSSIPLKISSLLNADPLPKAFESKLGNQQQQHSNFHIKISSTEAQLSSKIIQTTANAGLQDKDPASQTAASNMANITSQEQTKQKSLKTTSTTQTSSNILPKQNTSNTPKANDKQINKLEPDPERKNASAKLTYNSSGVSLTGDKTSSNLTTPELYLGNKEKNEENTENLTKKSLIPSASSEVSGAVPKLSMPRASDHQQRKPVANIAPFDLHSRRRDLINQLEQSIAKGDEQGAADAAAKLAQLKISCSVLSFSSQIVGTASTSAEPVKKVNEPVSNKEQVENIAKTRNNLVTQTKQSVSDNIAVSSSKISNEKRTVPTKAEEKEKNKSPNNKKQTLTEPSTSEKNKVTGNENVSIEVWIEDREAARGPIRMDMPRVAVMGDLRRRAIASFGLAAHLQRWIVGRTLCTDDNIPLNSLAGPNFDAPFYLCLVEPDTNKKTATNPETATTSNNKTETKKHNVNEVNGENKATDVYAELVLLERRALVPNAEDFECEICMEHYKPGLGAVLRECVHTFCKECLSDVVKHSEDPAVSCPAMGCPGFLQEREIRALVSQEDYERWLARGLAAAESGTRNAFHCRTRDCQGWALCEPGVTRFPCPVCKRTNCVSCQAIHEGATCEQYRAKQRESEASSRAPEGTDEGTRAFLDTLISRGEALECPECSTIITKKWGCDWIKCSACKTEICWVTRGRRWGPGGRGDTSAGCRCGVDGKRCHPSCGYCH